MLITHIHIYKYTIPMVPFTIATGTMAYAQNIFIRIYTDAGIVGVGECSAFPMIVGETQATCYEMAKDFATLWKGKNPLAIAERMNDLHNFTAGNYTAKSAFDMALYDIAAKHSNQPLYQFLGGQKKAIESDLTIGIGTPENMAQQAIAFNAKGVTIIKVKLGRQPQEDIERIKQIRAAIGNNIHLRIDANQGWTYHQAVEALTGLVQYNIQFCEQPMRKYNDHLLPQLCAISPIAIMADESVFTHHDAARICNKHAAKYINIKLAKSGGILEAININTIAEQNNIHCMMGGMLESRFALTANVHFAMAHNNIIFYDLDTCLLGHKIDPVLGGVKYQNMHLHLSDAIGIGADVDDIYLKELVQVVV
ncbi:MAG: dipeptide epimerase [Deinococcales bacterium]|nr:dipeptide epimerase [Chitinophagaceae bacterium]